MGRFLIALILTVSVTWGTGWAFGYPNPKDWFMSWLGFTYINLIAVQYVFLNTRNTAWMNWIINQLKKRR